ncbi:MAG: hypothetical protein EPO62_00495 [Candidatus Nitrosotenuis sp.]|nr:MAG: hypothetical protein EPO62_00495 [Candidatus Nitrosotenuis sp.]
MKTPLIFAFLLFSLSYAFVPVFGHGLGSETLSPVLIGNRNVTLAISESQLSPDSSQSSKIVAITMYETNTKKPVPNVTFHVIASRQGQVLFDHTFQRNNGDLDLDIITTNQEKVEIKEEGGASWIGQIVGSPSNFAIITGPIFGSGGLYNFKIEVLTADSYTNKLAPPIAYDVGLSIPDTVSYTVTDSNNSDQTIGIVTYYDQVSNFAYVPQNKTIAFEMPFDWSEKNISQVSVVHEEIRIPKSFGDFLSSKYTGSVNGFKLPDGAVVIDDYSMPDRLVHIIVNRNDLSRIKSTGFDHTIKFALSPSLETTSLYTYTKNAQYGITLKHVPDPLIAGVDATFLFEIREFPKNKTASVPYNFTILYNTKEILKQSGTTDQSSYTKIQTKMPNDVTGPITLRFDNVGGSSYATADFPLSVNIPKKPTQTFPISLFSFSNQNGSKATGKYQVDLTWFPTNLQIDESSEFVFTIKDISTGEAAANTSYEFIILQNGDEILRKPGFTSSGGDYVDYSFASGQEGSYLLRIEKIAGSDQLVEIPITVTPEFPASYMAVFALMACSIPIITRMKSDLFA